MLRSECLDQRTVFIAVLPRKNRVLRQQSVPESIEPSRLIIASAWHRRLFNILRDSHVHNPLPERSPMRIPRWTLTCFNRSRNMVSLSSAHISASRTSELSRSKTR
jgi:hypothetical protein